MTRVSIGDVAQTFLLRRQTTDMKAALQRLTQEMGSGRKADLAAAVSGDFRALAGIEHSLSTLASYRTAAAEAGLVAETLQTSLESVQTLAGDLAPVLAAAGTTGNPTQVATAAFDARQKLYTAVSALNVRVGDRYLLSGAATDRKPILGGQDLLAALNGAIAGQTTASGIAAAVTAWFDAPAGGGGYADTIYGGSATPLSPIAIGEGESAVIGLTADDDTLRDTLKGLALGALVAEGALPNDPAARAWLVRAAGETLMTATTDLAGLRANLGSVEGHIQAIATRNTAEASALEIARGEIVAADPYATASELEAVTTQLETLYTLTARLSRLTLTDFLS